MMMKIIDNSSAPSTKTELDLFTVPPTQVAVEKTRWLEVPLSNACTNEGPYEFHIPTSPHMLHLFKNYVFLEMRIVHPDGGALVHPPLENPDPLVGPINLIGKTFFNQVQVFLNGSEVFNSGNKYAYRAYLETILNHGSDSKESQLQACMYSEDPPEHIDDEDNTGLQNRARRFRASAWVQVMAPIHCDLFCQDRYLLNQTDLRVVLHRNIDRFLLMKFNGAQDYKIQLNSMRWFVKTVEVGPSVMMGIERTLTEFTAKYPIRRVELKSMNVAAGLRSTQNNSIFSGQLPRRLVIGCVDSDAFHGTYAKSPFNFKNYSIQNVFITAGGQTFPSKPLQMNFPQNHYVRAFIQLFEGLGIGGENKGNGVGFESFKNGSCLFAFDLSPDEDDGSHWDLIKDGSVTINIEFGDALQAAVEVVVYAEFDNLLTIDKHRNPTIDYRL